MQPARTMISSINSRFLRFFFFLVVVPVPRQWLRVNKEIYSGSITDIDKMQKATSKPKTDREKYQNINDHPTRIILGEKGQTKRTFKEQSCRSFAVLQVQLFESKHHKRTCALVRQDHARHDEETGGILGGTTEIESYHYIKL